MKYSIGQFSELSGFSIDTLRYYEKQKLLFPKRDENNRRVYSEKDVAWISFISRLKKTGMSIREMQKYAKLRYAGDQTIPERLVLLFNQLDNLHEEEKKIEDNIEFVEQKIKTYLKTIGDLKE
ncbi:MULTISPECIES: MerR family transcriptional regulator [Lactobacillus]|uniref:MerR family transcriptional regulator n=1 Tax=Lactobacillus melliventris TaxID=1218507 RepID=A0A0F4LGG8_9LACO|nr:MULTISPECIES: MerR family transcriptional regulator [Lactobacillus]MCT6847625.1 MerR family transcriptional regulator [Lactobacillus helsingborgensis]KJY56661.1 MerR family transcriptional regulator [Lactobacillus melliventris]MBC6349965.1 MerR family transcriptional regulator [Lactobacillus melliventris]MBH9990418.1 MerR family transcriptional regulator [Lactobacillus sp. M0392]MBI0024796.1 MerR family transcriptional regulator [Lactobacillus sp. W8171]